MEMMTEIVTDVWKMPWQKKIVAVPITIFLYLAIGFTVGVLYASLAGVGDNLAFAKHAAFWLPVVCLLAYDTMVRELWGLFTTLSLALSLPIIMNIAVLQWTRAGILEAVTLFLDQYKLWSIPAVIIGGSVVWLASDWLRQRRIRSSQGVQVKGWGK